MKTALVTGGSNGLGLAWVKQLLSEGYHVILTARNQQKANDAVASLKSISDEMTPRALDVSDEASIADAAMWFGENFQKLDLLINNAGINPKDFSDKTKMAKAFALDSFDPQVMSEVVQTNSFAPILMVKHLKPFLLKSPDPKVIHISSWLGSVSQLAFGGHYGYVGSKNLLNVLNKSMALEIKPAGITCVCVNPGWVQTNMGGSKANFTPDQAVQNILKNVVNKIQIQDTGRFLNYDGTDHPW